MLDQSIAQDAIENSAVNRLMTITGVNLAVTAGIMAAIGDISRFNNPQWPQMRRALTGPSTAAARSMAGTEEWPAAQPNKRMDLHRSPQSSRSLKNRLSISSVVRRCFWCSAGKS